MSYSAEGGPVDSDYVVAWQALCHDMDSNRYKPTSIETKVAVVMAAKSKVPGGEWSAVAKDSLLSNTRSHYIYIYIYI